MKSEQLVMIPGPTPTTQSIQNAMGRKTAAFKDPDFVEDFKGVLDDLKGLWKTDGEVFVVPGSGTLAMEMAVSNTLKPNDKVLIVSHGYFGDRFIEIADKKEYNYKVLSSVWGEGIQPKELQKELNKNDYEAVIVTHVDTSTGVKSPIKEYGKIIDENSEAIYIVDGVCSTAAEEEYVDPMNIDILLTGSQKAFGVAPGLAILWASKKALNKRKQLGNIREYYVDFDKWLPIMHDPSNYFATPAVNLIWALKESLKIIKNEGLQQRFNRHRKDADAIQQALQEMGFGLLAKPGWRASTLSNVLYPEGIEDEKFRNILKGEGVITAGGLGDYAGKLFRLGHMGNIDQHIIISTLHAIEKSLFKCGYDHNLGSGIKEYINARN